MTLTPEQIRIMRANAGIPEEGLGTSVSASDRIAKLREGAGFVDAPVEGADDEPGFIKRAFNEEIQKAGEKTSRLFEEDVPLAERVATAGTLPLKAAATTARIAGRVIAEPIAGVIGKAVDFLSDNKFIQAFAQSEAGERISRGAERVSEKLDNAMAEIEQKVSPEVFDAVKDAAELAMWIVGEKPATAIAKKTAQESLRTGVKVAKQVSKVGVDVGRKGVETISKKVTGLAERFVGKIDKFAVKQMDTALNLNPSDIRKIKRPNIAGESPSQWLLKRGAKGGREEILNLLDEIKITSKSQKEAGLASISTTYTNNTAKKALEVLKKTFEGVVGNEKLVEKLDNFLAKKEYSLTELDDIKRMIDNELDIFKTTGELKTSAQSKGLKNIRNELKTFIEDKATENGFPDVKRLNKDTQVSKEIAEAILKKEAALSSNRVLSLTDLIVGVGGVAGFDPLTGIGIVIAKKILESPEFKTALANRLSSLSPRKMAIIENAFKTGTKTEEYKNVMKEVISEIKTK